MKLTEEELKTKRKLRAGTMLVNEKLGEVVLLIQNCEVLHSMGTTYVGLRHENSLLPMNFLKRISSNVFQTTNVAIIDIVNSPTYITGYVFEVHVP